MAWIIVLGAWIFLKRTAAVERFVAAEPDDGVKVKSIVTQIFHDVLWRNPSPQELDLYTSKMRDDQAFDADTLRTLLYTSDEFRRLEKVQNNMARTNLMGDVTDRQLTYLVKTSYARMFGDERAKKDLDHDEVYLEFLKRKYVEAMYDAPRFEAYLSDVDKATTKLAGPEDLGKNPAATKDNGTTSTSTVTRGEPIDQSASVKDDSAVDMLVKVSVPKRSKDSFCGTSTASMNGLQMTPLEETQNQKILPALPPR